MSLEIASGELGRLERLKAPPAILYHYTKPAGLRGILRSEDVVFRASNIFYLNDASEFLASLVIIQELLKNFLLDPAAYVDGKVAIDKDDRFFVECARSDLKTLGELPSGNQFFVACFSSSKDDLGQWRAYGRGEGGLAIGLNGQSLREEVGRIGGFLLPVIYYGGSTRAQRYVDAVNRSIIDITLDAAATYKVAVEAVIGGSQKNRVYKTAFLNWFESVGLLMCVIKNPGFVVEKEWRIIVRRELIDVDFLDTSYFLKPYCEIHLNKDQLVREVGIGPGRLKALSRSSAESYLYKCGYDPMFWISNIPYRVMEG